MRRRSSRDALSATASRTGWIPWASCDDAQDLARRGLLLERLGQLAVPRLELLEQPYVLDRDHRLVGEGPEELDLALGEGRPSGRDTFEGAEDATFP